MDFKLAFKTKFKGFRNLLLARFIYKMFKINANFFEKKDYIRGIRTCNISFFKNDFNKIHGFNENFIGWGREDSEFVARFLFNGGILRRLKFAGLAYHLWHEENSRKNLEKNEQIYKQTLNLKRKDWRENGN